MMKEIYVAPSILSADFANLEKDIKRAEKAGADFIHVDVMDGHFVPNISIGVPVVKSIRKITGLPLDVHLMIDNPEFFADKFIDSGADILTFHYEATDKPKELLKKIRARNVKSGISIKPNTLPNVLEGLYEYIDLILVMTVEPGFGGQKFMPECAEKLLYYRDKNISNVLFEVDGGINDKTSKIAIKNGANVLVAGSYIYNSSDMQKSINELKISDF